MTRIVRNKNTNKYVTIDFDSISPSAFEVDLPQQATIFNEEIDEMDDVILIETVMECWSEDTEPDLEIVNVNVIVEFID